MFQNRNVMELRFLPPLANGNGNGPGNGNGNGNCIARDLALEQPNAEEQLDEDGEEDTGLPAVASSSCETLEACDEAVKLNLHQKLDKEPQDPQNLEAPSKPLPPLPKKPTNHAGQVSLSSRSKIIAHGDYQKYYLTHN